MNLFDLYGYCFILLFFYLFYWDTKRNEYDDNLDWDIELDDFMKF